MPPCVPPAHDDRPGRQPALHDLVPADQLPAFRCEVAVDAVGEVGLQLRLVMQPLGRDTGLAVGAGLPAGVLAFVAADVDQLRGKERDDLVEHVFEEFERALLARTEDVVRAADPTRYFVGFVSVPAPQPGVGRQGRERVSGHFDFGDDRDVPLGGIGDDLADLVLRVKAAVPPEFEGGGLLLVAADLGFRTPRPDLGQARVAFDLDAPALVVGQVPVKGVELGGGHAVEVALHELHGEKVAADVQVESPVAVAGVVLDLGTGDVTVGVGHLQERLESVEDAAFIARREFCRVFGDAEPVSFGGDAARASSCRKSVFRVFRAGCFPCGAASAEATRISPSGREAKPSAVTLQPRARRALRGVRPGRAAG